jgi:hypothetical protein
MWRFSLISHAWTLLPSTSTDDWPPRRSLHAMALLQTPQTSTLVLHGGLNRDDTWMYDIAQHTWRQWQGGSSPLIRHGTGLVPFQGRLLLFGGGRLGPVEFYNDVWAFEPKLGWQQLTSTKRDSIGNQHVLGPGAVPSFA